MESPLLPFAAFSVVSALLVAGGLGGYWLVLDMAGSRPDTVTVSLVIDFGYPGELTFADVVCADATPYGLLRQVAGESGFTVDSRYYPQFDSLMVEAIDGVSNGDNGRYWQYYVNGEMPMESADACVLSDGDTVKWSFEVPTWS